MRLSSILKPILVIALCPALFAATPAGPVLSPFSVELSPQTHIPLTDAEGIFQPAVGVALGGNFAFRELPGLGAGVTLGYAYGNLGFRSASGTSSISEASLGAHASYTLPLVPWLSARAFAGGGLTVGGMNGASASTAFYGNLEGGLGLNFNLDPQLTLRLEAAWLQKFGLYGGLRTGASVVWNIPDAPAGGSAGGQQIRLLDFTEVKLGSVFPIMQTYYDEHPIGTVKITNTSKETVKDLKVTFLMRQYMDGPKASALVPQLAPGETKDVPLFALFKSNIFDVTEATKATAELGMEYQGADGLHSQSTTASIRVYDRNAMTWDDDNKAAAFVSGKDPWVLDLSNNITAAVKDLRNDGLPANLQTAMAFHDGLRLYGLSYVTNPKNPFAQTFANPETVDFLKFPRQTLAYKAGDCSDLSILYASFFESVGVESAFVTVPGHIYVAYNLDISPATAKAVLSGADDLIYFDGKTWMPLEVTMREGSLQDIWQEGAREWRQGQAAKTAAFYPIHEAWKTFAPVGLPADSTSADPLSKNKIALSFENELDKLIEQELSRKLAVLNAAISSAPSPKNYNARGVLYARFGKLNEAEKDFRAASATAAFVPALINLGNISVLKLDNKAAYDAYQRAAKLSPGNPKLEVNLAKVAMALGKNDEAVKAMAEVKSLDPALAEQYSSVAMAASDSGTRAANKNDKTVLWVDE